MQQTYTRGGTKAIHQKHSYIQTMKATLNILFSVAACKRKK